MVLAGGVGRGVPLLDGGEAGAKPGPVMMTDEFSIRVASAVSRIASESGTEVKLMSDP